MTTGLAKHSLPRALVWLGVLILTGTSSEALAKAPVVKIAGKHVVKLEVASTDAEIQHGLMGRTSMPEDNGMVFLFHPQKPVNFWMCHTLIPLDMLFVRDGKIIRIFEHVPPCKDETCANCPTYPAGPGVAVTEVIELNGGYASRHGVKEGDPVAFELP
jgi:uncharacterized membrane protein (UPF0127 family)